MPEFFRGNLGERGPGRPEDNDPESIPEEELIPERFVPKSIPEEALIPESGSMLEGGKKNRKKRKKRGILQSLLTRKR
jgi:hypothetical protein